MPAKLDRARWPGYRRAMRPQAIWVDAFTEKPFAGNPAVVVLIDEPAGEAWMGSLAREMGVSETAFVSPRAAGSESPDRIEAADASYDLRWFTPDVEVDLCGHATLASAHALWQEGRVSAGTPIHFHTRSGILGAVRRDSWIELDFPAAPAAAEAAPRELLDALGAGLRWSGRTDLGDWLLELEDEAIVRNLAPDYARLAVHPARGIIVTARADGDHDFVSRFFAPAVGIDEDPVTGSAHCALAPFWAERLGRDQLTGYQASPRGGIVRVRLAGSRVILSGKAVTVLRGELA
jgi:PhzF family phenazine biosynthesis protein